MISKSTRGSEWRKWDLHIHTPASDGTGTAEEIVDTAISKGLSVIAITDHHTTDYIDKVKEAAKDKKLTVISGIEFRSEYGAKSVHFIAYFPEEYNGTKLTSQNLYELILCKLKLSRAEIITKAKSLKSYSSEDKAFHDGIFLLQVNLKEAAELIHSYGGIISVHNGQKSNGLDEEVKHKGTAPKNVRTLDECLGPLKDELMNNYIDICDLGVSDDDNEREFYLKQFNTPSILASDAHKYEDIGSSFSWIKANPSFEGLKQIIYEPISRVSLKTEKPEFKNDYQIIDSIEFNNPAMGTQKIEFNQNLNTIIGGRSSGKSILLGCLANIIDPSQKPKENQDAYNENIKKLIKDASVLWRDGSTETRKIIYYSQSKISEIVRPDENGISGINKLVNRIVRTDENKVELLQAYDKAVIANRTELVSKINDFCEIKKQIQEKNDEIRDIGIKKGIQQEIEKLEKEIESIKKELKDYLSASDEQLYKEKVEKLEKLQECRKLLTSDIAQYDIAENSELFTSLDSLLSSFSSLNHDLITKFYELLKEETKEKWVDFIKNQKIEISEKINKVDEKVTEITKSEIFIKGNSFKDNNEVLSKKDSDLQKEKQKKNSIEKIEIEISKLQESLNNCKNDIFVSFAKYKTLANELSEKLQMKKKDVEIKANVHLLYKDFFKLVLESINRTKKENQKYEDYETISPSSREELISNLFDGIINDEIVLKKQFHQVLTDLFSNNYYTISYDVTYDNDSFEKMSEGKKAFIVLRLLLDFDDSVCPIIIDQPEDDLDNRAIYDQLVKYLKEQKKERQIILATHNPNVVVGADAELVIVANQNGIDSPNQDNIQFEYYGNSIEDTFENKECCTVLLSKGIREHICEILEGGTAAFQIREKKYGYNVN